MTVIMTSSHLHYLARKVTCHVNVECRMYSTLECILQEKLLSMNLVPDYLLSLMGTGTIQHHHIVQNFLLMKFRVP